MSSAVTVQPGCSLGLVALMRAGSHFSFVLSLARKKRKEQNYSNQRRQCALRRKGSLTSKLANVTTKGPSD
eukprot:1159144-Pelagomonas_calceolata.AAC.5